MNKYLEGTSPWLENQNDSVPLSGDGAEVIRLDDKTIMATMPNGGYVILVSDSPIKAFGKPE